MYSSSIETISIEDDLFIDAGRFSAPEVARLAYFFFIFSVSGPLSSNRINP